MIAEGWPDEDEAELREIIAAEPKAFADYFAAANAAADELVDEGIAPGAVRSVAYYLTRDGKPAPKKTARRVEIHEFDSADKLIRITYAEI